MTHNLNMYPEKVVCKLVLPGESVPLKCTLGEGLLCAELLLCHTPLKKDNGGRDGLIRLIHLLVDYKASKQNRWQKAAVVYWNNHH